MTSELQSRQTGLKINPEIQRYSKKALLLTVTNTSRFVGDGHGHKVLVTHLDNPVQVGVPRFEGVGERSEHDTGLDEVVEL